MRYMSEAFGVGNNPDPIPQMKGSNGTSWNNERLCEITFFFQIGKHVAEVHSKDSRHIFTKHPSWPSILDDIQH